MLDMAGYTTLNVVITDYNTYAAAYVCHSFLLEHIVIPFAMTRCDVKGPDVTDVQRIKWSLVKQVNETKRFPS